MKIFEIITKKNQEILDISMINIEESVKQFKLVSKKLDKFLSSTSLATLQSFRIPTLKMNIKELDHILSIDWVNKKDRNIIRYTIQLQNSKDAIELILQKHNILL